MRGDALRLVHAVVLLAAAAGAAAIPLARKDRWVVRPQAGVPGGRPADTTPDAMDATVQEDPFRLDRQLSAIPFGDLPQAAQAAPIPEESDHEAERPSWRLSGIVWGDAPLALLEGAGEDGGARILAKGDSVGEIVVLDVGPDSVLLGEGAMRWTFGFTRQLAQGVR